jgi:formate hydrogenlyase subunit 6/NADH:ubiquinone oxidoreductase subunit I
MLPVLPYLGTAVANLFKKPVTEKFPAGAAPEAAPHYRGRIAYDPEKCINCGMCERVCAPHCMTRTQRPAPGGAPGDLEVSFTFDLTSCTFCGLCSDFCARKAITLTQDYMMTGTKTEDFLVGGTFLKKAPPKPKFTPEQLAAMKAAALAKRQAAAGGAAAKPATEANPATEAKAEANPEAPKA